MLTKTRTKTKAFFGKLLGTGYEGRVSAVKVRMSRNGRRHFREMAVKRFRRRVINAFPANRRPEMHFLVYEYLRKLNREERMGLNLLPTWRIATQSTGEKVILKTKLPPLGIRDLSAAHRREYQTDIKRQQQIIRSKGIMIPYKDAFYPYIEPNTGKCIAVINDVGTIVLPEWQTKLRRMALLPGIRRIMKVLGQVQGKIRKL